MNLSSRDRDLLIRTVIGEAADQPDIGKAAVAHTVLNRVDDGNFGDGVQGVLFKPKQFEPWDTRRKELLSYTEDNPTYQNTSKIVDDVISGNIKDPTNGATHFANVDTVKARRNNSALGWINGMQNVTKIGDHTFGNANAGKDKMSKINVDDLYKEFSGSPKSEPLASKSNDELDVDSLYKEFSGNQPALKPIEQKSSKFYDTVVQGAKNTASGVGQGIKDVFDSGFNLLAHAPARSEFDTSPDISPEERQKYIDQENRLYTADKNKFETENPDTLSAAGLGRIGGQVLATAPLTPVRAIQGASAGIKALPYVGNRLTALMGTGALSGANFGLATNSTSDDGLLTHVGKNAVAGLLGAPLVAASVAIGSKVANTASKLWANVNISNIAKATGESAPALKNIVNRLDELGISPQEAQARLNKMGPQATLADIDPALTTEAGGLASIGGKPTSTLKNAFAERAEGADSRATNLIENKLGPKPDLEAEKEAIVKEARTSTAADYKKAHSDISTLDAKPLIDNIDQQLENAVGSKAKELATAKSYLYDANGNLKNSVKQLHEARIGLDERLRQLPAEGSPQQSATYRALSNTRNEVDKLLKSNVNMSTADQKFAEKMDIKKGLDTGYQAFTKKTSFDNFEKEFSTASPEEKETIRKGLHAAIGDYMEQASRGELSGAQQLFGKKSVNRKILKEAFGNDADEILDTLSHEAAMRHTEQRVISNSATAERRAVQERPEYGGAVRDSNLATNIAQGAMLDLATGTPGGATAIGAAKSGLAGIKNKIYGDRIKNTIEGSADILSRNGYRSNNVLSTLDRVKSIQDGRLNLSSKNSKLPITIGTPTGDEVIKRIKNIRAQI
jgi:hypothetical protein